MNARYPFDMSLTRTWIVSAVALGLLGAACGAPDVDGTGYRSGTEKRPNTSSSADDSTAKAEKTDGDSTTPAPDPDAKGPVGDPAALPVDTDKDGVPDSEDCDPASAAIAGTKLLDDDLSTDRGFFSTASGFPTTSWSFAGGSYRQARLADAADATLFTKDAAISDVTAEVTGASIEVGAITPRLRQMFILLGTAINGGVLSAVGCGIEVAQGEATEQKTSIVRLSGAATGVSTTPLQRVNRPAVQANELFKIKARLSGGTLTCEVTQGATPTTTTAVQNVGATVGSVGLFTRQTKALYKDARICKLKPTTP